MPLKREGLFRRIYRRLNGEDFSLYKCTNCGDGPMHIKGDPSSDPCDNCGLVAWRELNDVEFVFETDLVDYFASNEDKLIALGETQDVGLQETKTQQELQELKRHFEDFADSMKATQMEVLRAIDRSDRHPSDYEPYLTEHIGHALYSCLQAKTTDALRRAELLFDTNREPHGFGPSVLTMSLGYENELFIRVFWSFLVDLQRIGTRTYDAEGKTREKLIDNGKVRTPTLGTLGWYLENDPTIRDSVSKRGFDVKVISKDVGKVNHFRNKSAHSLNCDRTLADELRRIMLSPDGVLRRLHPILATG